MLLVAKYNNLFMVGRRYIRYSCLSCLAARGANRSNEEIVQQWGVHVVEECRTAIRGHPNHQVHRSVKPSDPGRPTHTHYMRGTLRVDQHIRLGDMVVNTRHAKTRGITTHNFKIAMDNFQIAHAIESVFDPRSLASERFGRCYKFNGEKIGSRFERKVVLFPVSSHWVCSIRI